MAIFSIDKKFDAALKNLTIRGWSIEQDRHNDEPCYRLPAMKTIIQDCPELRELPYPKFETVEGCLIALLCGAYTDKWVTRTAIINWLETNGR
jgi:hypothetical protein